MVREVSGTYVRALIYLYLESWIRDGRLLITYHPSSFDVLKKQMRLARKLLIQSILLIGILIVIIVLHEHIKNWLEKQDVIRSMTLTRSSCLGECPAYSLHIDESGDVTFVGKANVSKLGIQEGSISKAEFKELNRHLINFNYAIKNFPALPKAIDPNLVKDKLFEVCPEYLTDHPSMTISIHKFNGDKIIHHYLGCRGLDVYKTVIAIGNEIDRIGSSDKWVYPQSGV